ncbi:MAG: DsbA family protein, partial [Thermoanaerobaculaceae bacterium]|nr:DsbA family protein [Thermoanaerobaculaceae bacterium]
LPTRPTGVVPLTLEIFSGYGWVRIPAAITMDGAYFMLGSSWPLDRDPRAVRRDMLRDAAVRWDPEHGRAAVTLVEFSDFQCPACKHSWVTVKEVLGKLGGTVRHGMVNYPLTSNHPWAFAAAVAGECVGRTWPDRFLPVKEEFYRLQDSMSVESVKDAARGFLAQQSLPEKPFVDCFMQDAVVDQVLRQIELAQRMGVIGTPTYFANGEIESPANKEWMVKRLQAIAAAKGIPESAAEIQVDPTPAATGKAAAGVAPLRPSPAAAQPGGAPGSAPR